MQKCPSNLPKFWKKCLNSQGWSEYSFKPPTTVCNVKERKMNAKHFKKNRCHRLKISFCYHWKSMMCPGVHDTTGTWGEVSISTWRWDRTPVVRLAWQLLYPLNHLAGSSLPFKLTWEDTVDKRFKGAKIIDQNSVWLLNGKRSHRFWWHICKAYIK